MLEIECDLNSDIDSLHHEVMANVRAARVPDHNLQEEEGYIEYDVSGDAYKLCHQDDDPMVVPGPDQDPRIREYMRGPRAKELKPSCRLHFDAGGYQAGGPNPGHAPWCDSLGASACSSLQVVSVAVVVETNGYDCHHGRTIDCCTCPQSGFLDACARAV